MEQRSSGERRSYEDVNGPVPRGPPIDENGLAQQVCEDVIEPRELFAQDLGMEPAHWGIEVGQEVGPGLDAGVPCFQSASYVSNIGPSAGSAFLENAVREQEQRRASGFTADNPGRPGGEYSEDNPPPGFRFGGYLKGNIGIVWHPVETPQEQVAGTAARDKGGAPVTKK